MDIVFRTDSSLIIGTGHVMRCLNLAQALRSYGAHCRFICREHEGNLFDVIHQHGFEVQALPMKITSQKKILQQDEVGENALSHAEWLGATWESDAQQTLDAIGEIKIDWLIVDHYALDINWENMMSPLSCHLMVIDDLADRLHNCDLLLDQNFEENCRYESLVPSKCLLLTGPKYALLRNEYKIVRLKKRDNIVKRIFVFFGGVDKDDLAGITLSALSKADLCDLWVDIVIGSNYAHIERLNKLSITRGKSEIHYQQPHLAYFMEKADLAIGAVGVTNWERMCVGLPSIVISVADNQVLISKKLHELGAINWIGSSNDASCDVLYKEIKKEIDSEKFIQRREIASAMCDGEGIERVLSHIMSLDKDTVKITR